MSRSVGDESKGVQKFVVPRCVCVRVDVDDDGGLGGLAGLGECSCL